MIKLFKYLLSGLMLFSVFLLEVSFASVSKADVVFGRVVDFNRTPLEGVEVTVTRSTETVGVVESDGDGYYAVGSCTVEILDNLTFAFVKSKYISSESYITVSEPSVAECSEKRLQRGTGTERLLTVNVVSSRVPVPEAKVRFRRAGDYAIVKYTSSLGQCVLDRLRDKKYSYIVTCPGYQKLKGTKTVTGDEEIDLELTPE